MLFFEIGVQRRGGEIIYFRRRQPRGLRQGGAGALDRLQEAEMRLCRGLLPGGVRRGRLALQFAIRGKPGTLLTQRRRNRRLR